MNDQAFAIRFGAGKARRYLAHAQTEGAHAKGWRPFVWVKDIERAETFGSEASAQDFGRANLVHERWDVVIAPSRGIPTDDLGGTPAAARIAA